MSKPYYVYIVTNQEKSVFYTSVTNNLPQRLVEHFFGNVSVAGFASKYNAWFLVYYEWHLNVKEASQREKEIKSWRRYKKLELIREFNPAFKFLNKEIVGYWPPRRSSRVKPKGP